MLIRAIGTRGKGLETTTKQLKRASEEGVQRFFDEYVSQLEGRIREGGQFGCHKHPKGIDVQGKRTFNSEYIMDEEVRLLRDIGLIRELSVRWFQKSLNTTSPALGLPLIVLSPTISKSGLLAVRWTTSRLRMRLEDAIWATANSKEVGLIASQLNS